MQANTFEAEVMYSERNRKLLIVKDHKFGFHKALSCGAKRYKCAKRGCRAYLKIREPSTVIDSNLIHNHECNPTLTRYNLSYEKLDKPKPLYNTLNRLKSALTGEIEIAAPNKHIQIDITRSQSPSHQDPHNETQNQPSDNNHHHTIEPITITRSKLDGTSDTTYKPLKYFIKDKNTLNNHRRKLLKKIIDPVNISKRSKRFTDLQTKLSIIDKSTQGLRTSDISKEYNLPWTTVDSILKNRDRYLDAAQNVPGEVRLLKARQDIFVIMEEHLINWIVGESSAGRPLNSTEIRKMAKKIFDELKLKDTECKADFSASKGWFNRFMGRSGLKAMVRNDAPYTYTDYDDSNMNFMHSSIPYETSYEGTDGYEMDEGAESMMMEIPVECVLKTNCDNNNHRDNNNSDNSPTANEMRHRLEEQDEEEEGDEYEASVKVEDEVTLSKKDLEQIFKRIDEIGAIMNKDPLKNRAFMCFNAIQSACLPYKMRLEEMEQGGKPKTDVDGFFRQKMSPVVKRETLSARETAAACRLDANFYAPKQLSLALTASPSPVSMPYLHLASSELTISQIPSKTTVVNSSASASPPFLITEVKSLQNENIS